MIQHTHLASPPSLANPRVVQLIAHDMDGDRAVDARLTSILSEQEVERSRRFRSPHHGQYYRAGRARLRQTLSMLMECDPEGIEFHEGPNGKPWVEGSPPFNVSHCGNWLLIGLAADGLLGVDVEQVRQIDGLEAIASRYFAQAERESILALAQEDRSAAFLRVWTRKEAFIKALGAGLSVDLSGFEVDHGDHYENALTSVHLPGQRASTWWVGSVPLGAALFVAVATDAATTELQVFRELSSFASSRGKLAWQRARVREAL